MNCQLQGSSGRGTLPEAVRVANHDSRSSNSHHLPYEGSRIRNVVHQTKGHNDIEAAVIEGEGLAAGVVKNGPQLLSLLAQFTNGFYTFDRKVRPSLSKESDGAASTRTNV
jgi:hypothetical protein